MLFILEVFALECWTAPPCTPSTYSVLQGSAIVLVTRQIVDSRYCLQEEIGVWCLTSLFDLFVFDKLFDSGAVL
jgi:hypothetical protein